MPHLIVTSISPPNDVMRSHAAGARGHGWNYVVIGDRKSPDSFTIDGCRFVGIHESLPFAYARVCGENSYTRKNLGYLIAMAEGAGVIVETDDDNHALESFWAERTAEMTARRVDGNGWVNAYRYFGEKFCYPRGIPLHHARESWDSAPIPGREEPGLNCPIQQGLADGHPDIDAVFRMLNPEEIFFDQSQAIALKQNQWCPVNSQNTTWFPKAYPLLYLPSTCSFRMTDIWRGFVAQRIAWEYGWHIAFHAPTVRQFRNEHNLLADFQDEIPGYLGNENIIRILGNLPLNKKAGNLPEQLKICYGALISGGYIDETERPFLVAWCEDVGNFGF